MDNIDVSNKVFMQAASFVEHTRQTIFLTGKAGTGKTTFLKYIREHSIKKMAVIAPTGVAAINARGTTIHSFFQLPFGTYIPSQTTPWGGGAFQNVFNKSQLLRNQRLRQPQRTLIKSLELLVIDEVSMVRADVLDAMDAVMRSVRRKPYEPFGGVQMLFIGDMYQLPPVVKNEEWNLMAQHYKSPFFFDAQVMREVSMLYLELKKIYRQKDDAFINILQNVRNNCCLPDDLAALHERYQPQFSALSDSGYITLTTHNRKADTINQIELDKLPGKSYSLNAKIEKNFPEHAYPADPVLHLKEGAQVMFIKNDKGENRRYFNGKIGKVKKIIPEESITVAFENEPETIELDMETWKNIRYDYDKEKDKVNEEELGSFRQYPIRLAWAVTIHKSQGLTFEKAIIDAGQSFAPGQVYVALSRLTSLEGLILHSRIQPQNIMVDPRISRFAEQKLPEEKLEETLQQSRQDYAHALLLQAYDYNDFTETFRAHAASYAGKLIPDRNIAFEWAQKLLVPVYRQQETAQKFNAFLQGLFNVLPVDYTRAHERNMAAAAWFVKDLEENIRASIKKHIEDQTGKPRTKKYIGELEDLLTLAEHKGENIKRTPILTEVLAGNADLEEAFSLLKPVVTPKSVRHQDDTAKEPQKTKKKKKEKPATGTTKELSLRLFREGKTIEEIAQIRNYVPSTIVSHLISFIPEGLVDVSDLVSQQKINVISAVVKDNPTATSGIIKEILGAGYSYPEIKAVMAFEQKQADMA
jgi:hypothetical protein